MRKSYTIRLLSDGIETLYFECPEHLSVFRAARLAGIEMSAGCMQGRCQMCRATLCTGTVKSLRPLSKYATTDPAAMPNGTVLPCSVVPCSDVAIEPRGPWRVDPSMSSSKSSFTMLNPEAMPLWD